MNEPKTTEAPLVLDPDEVVGFARTGTRVFATWTTGNGSTRTATGFVSFYVAGESLVLEACGRAHAVGLGRLRAFGPVTKSKAVRP